ncbi:MAG: undecaprenyl-diphosphate phosphatase [Bacteroidales bacterium]|nr:undecaprenyl-diphosphate phosphatase [Bacteroidales bacterium]MDD4574813.1 undecaprenyl-diphosphate phosphatase [Bacteroidales bacterium]
MNWIEALFLGIVQGLTEFLPVSSSGHLEIGNHILGLKNAGESNLTFTLVVHAATVLSTLTVFYKDIFSITKGLFKFENNEETQFVTNIIISMIPVAIVGLFFKDQVEALFTNDIIFVGFALLLTASLLIMSQLMKKTNKEINPLRAFVIGLSQALAVIPGLSRSGATIATGLLLGVKRERMARFSFLMVIVPVLGESFLELLKGDLSAEVSGIPIHVLIVGFLGAYLSGLFACKAMINLVSKAKLHYFAIYCIVVGLSVIILNGFF